MDVVVPRFKHYPSIRLQGMKKMTGNLSQNSWLSA
jgi:hypothetical protein